MTTGLRYRALGLVLCAAVLNACDSKKGTQEPPPTPTIAIAVGAANVNVLPGGNASVAVTLTRGGNFTGPVTVTAEGLPNGVTVAQTTIGAGATTGTLNIAAAAAAAVGTTPITVRATGSGVSAATATFTLNVQQPPAIQISLNPTTVTAQIGGGGSTAVTVTRLGGFTGPVDLQFEGVPNGVTTAAGTIPAGSTSGTVTFNAGATAVAGTSNVTVRATGTGVSPATAALTLNVTAAPVPPSIVVAVNPATLSVQQGGNANFTVTLTRQNFTGDVTVTASGLPANVTLPTVVIPAAQTSAQMTVNVGAGAQLAATNITLTATGGGATGTATLGLTVTGPPGIAIALNPTDLAVTQGGTGSIGVTLVRTSFNGAVTLSAEGIPANVTIPNVVIPEGATTAQMTVTAAANAAAGPSNVTIRATGTGVTAATAPLVLTVLQAAGFTMSLNQGTISVAQGGQGQSTLTVARAGTFSGAVNLAATGAPAGMTVSFNPASVTQTTSVITVQVGAGVQPNTYPITITGTGTGVANQAVTLNVTVTGGTGGGNVTFQFCEADGLPLWVAAQDGAGAWQRVTGNAQNEYSFQVSSGRGGVAYVMSDGGSGFDLSVYYFTTQEMQLQGAGECTTTPGATRTVNVALSGVSATELAWVSLGGAMGFFMGAFPTPVQLEGVAPGVVDLLASRMTLDQVVNRLFLQRGLNPANNSTVAVDFAGPNSFAPATRTLTVQNAGSDVINVAPIFMTSGGGFLLLGATQGAGSTFQFSAVPVDRVIAGDWHLVSVSALVNENDPENHRGVARVSQAAQDLTLSLGPALAQPTVTVLTTQPYVRMQASYAVQPEYNTFFMANFNQSSRGAGIQMSSGYNANAATAVLAIPDFTGVAGWQNTWGLQAGSSVTWTVQGLGYSTGNLVTPFSEGQTWTFAQRSGTITP